MSWFSRLPSLISAISLLATTYQLLSAPKQTKLSAFPEPGIFKMTTAARGELSCKCLPFKPMILPADSRGIKDLIAFLRVASAC